MMTTNAKTYALLKPIIDAAMCEPSDTEKWEHNCRSLLSAELQRRLSLQAQDALTEVSTYNLAAALHELLERENERIRQTIYGCVACDDDEGGTLQ